MPLPAPSPVRLALRAAAALALLAGAVTALADGTPDPWGLRAPPGTSVTSEIGPEDPTDADDFVFRSVPGQKTTITIKALKGGLDPIAEVRRGDGTKMEPEDGVLVIKQTGVTIKITLTARATDTYKVRVFGKFPEGGTVRTMGPYSLSLKQTGIPRGKVSGVTPDANGQLRYSIPAQGGALLTATLKWKGGAPDLREIDAPGGAAINGLSSKTTVKPTSIQVKGFEIPRLLPFGDYDLVFDTDSAAPPTNVVLSYSVKHPKGEKARKGKLDPDEPFVNAVDPVAGGTGTVITVTGGAFQDQYKADDFRLYIGRHEVTGAAPIDAGSPTALRGTVPAGIPFGTYDVIVETSTGQVGVKAGSFSVVASPIARTIDPDVGSTVGGYELVITGEGFRPGKMGITIGGITVPVNPTEITPTTVKFLAPPRGPGQVTFGVIDRDTQLRGDLPINSFTYTTGPAIQRIVPTLVPILGQEDVFVRGANLNANLHVFLEDEAGDFIDVTPAGGFVDSTKLKFTSPLRAAGTYDLYVRDVTVPQAPNSAIRQLRYFTYGDFTPDLNLASAGSEQFDAATSALADFDRDGDQDLFLSRAGGSTLNPTSHTRVLRNDGDGGLTDITGGANGVMPPLTSDDDWRADRILVTDVTKDGYADIVIVTNSGDREGKVTGFPAADKSHLRVLRNESRNGTDVADRVFRDRTADLIPPPRIMKKYAFFGSGAGEFISDNWRALDMWIGDIDSGSYPEILFVHDEQKDDSNSHDDVFASGVYCGNYCKTQGSYPISYAFYWGGGRKFVWDPNARGGAGRFRFDPDFFPRKSGVTVPQVGPGGQKVAACSAQAYGSTPATPCAGQFAPFIGQRIAVSDINADGFLDVAVLSNGEVTKKGDVVSSLQIGINKFDTTSGSQLTDLTPGLPTDTRADTLAIGHPGFPDGNAFGVVATSKFVPGPNASSVMRLFKYKPGVDGALGDFDDVTAAMLANAPMTVTDKRQASAIAFFDLDGDGDEDMLLLAKAAPGPGNALRVLRNLAVSGQTGLMSNQLQPLLDALVTGTDHFEGDCLAIGDLDGDTSFDFVVTRAVPVGLVPQTRAVNTE